MSFIFCVKLLERAFVPSCCVFVSPSQYHSEICLFCHANLQKKLPLVIPQHQTLLYHKNFLENKILSCIKKPHKMTSITVFRATLNLDSLLIPVQTIKDIFAAVFPLPIISGFARTVIQDIIGPGYQINIRTIQCKTNHQNNTKKLGDVTK